MRYETSDNVPLYKVDVIFDPTEDPPVRVAEANIHMPPGLSMVEFNLVGPASFLSYPLQWMENPYGLAGPPPYMSVARLDDSTVILTNSNRTARGQADVYPYMLLVFSGGHVFATDPTIINIPPGSG
ncbi:MAG: hypothetical protein KDD47_20560 [Acidobacteria bacterium]|nr:hypothetical protein [Acidobacteriota bacterium]